MGAPWLERVTDSPAWPNDEVQVMEAVESARSALGRLSEACRAHHQHSAETPRDDRAREVSREGSRLSRALDPMGRVAAAASMRAARASAALSGAPLVLDPRASSVTDPVLAGAVRVAAALGGAVGTWRRAPRQVLARLHTLAAADLAASDELGRPRLDAERPDLRSGRLAALSELVVRSPWPAPVVVAIVHGELLTMAPFGSADGVVGRAAARLTMISRGLDHAEMALPEVAHLRSTAQYRSGLDGYAGGGAAGVDAWVVQECLALSRGAAEGSALAAAYR